MAPGTRAGVSLIEITNDAGSIVYGSVSDPSSDTPSIPLTTPITATTTVTQYKIRVTPKIHVAMPVPPGASYALTASVSSWTGTNAQAGSNGGGTTITIDNLSPGNVTGATATAGRSAAHGGVDQSGRQPTSATIVVLRRAGSPVAVTPTEGVNYFVGDTIGSSIVACVVTAPATSCTDHEVDNGTVYHYKIFAQRHQPQLRIRRSCRPVRPSHRPSRRLRTAPPSAARRSLRAAPPRWPTRSPSRPPAAPTPSPPSP